MKNVSALLLSMTIIVVSCNNNNSPESRAIGTTEPKVPKATEEKMQSCYLGVTGKDTTKLSITVSANIVTGNLDYKRYDKDSNSGTIEGTMKGDTLLANYTFNSEGSLSVREVIFLIKDSIAMEGYGKMAQKNQKLVIENPSAIPFEKGQLMHKTDCR